MMRGAAFRFGLGYADISGHGNTMEDICLCAPPPGQTGKWLPVDGGGVYQVPLARYVTSVFGDDDKPQFAGFIGYRELFGRVVAKPYPTLEAAEAANRRLGLGPFLRHPYEVLTSIYAR